MQDWPAWERRLPASSTEAKEKVQVIQAWGNQREPANSGAGAAWKLLEGGGT